MNNFVSKLVSVLAVFLLLVYAGYQVYRYVYTPYRTETAYEYTVYDSLYCEGLVVRDEVALQQQGSGSVSYCVEEGEKIKAGSEIIRYYDSDSQARSAAHAERLENELALLREVQSPGSYQFANTESLTGRIDELIGSLVDTTADGSAEGVEDLRTQLLESICKRQLSVNEVENFEGRIAQLEAQRDSYRKDVLGEVQSLHAPEQGYFSRYSDGCESRFTSEALFEMTAADLADAISGEYPLLEDSAGKIMTEHNWYCAMALSAEDGERFRLGNTVDVTFESESLPNVKMEVYSVEEENETGNTIVILRSKNILPGIFSARSVSMRVHFSTHTGLRVSDGAVRLVDGKVGVYVTTGYEIRFKPIEVLYQGDGYQICRESFDGASNLKMFDKVIVKGTDLYDGKPLV